MIGCAELDITKFVIGQQTQQCQVLCPSLTAPENPKLGQINFTVTVAPFDPSKESQAVEGRHKGKF